MQHEVKPSVQRMAVMEYMIKHHNHPSVDEIYTSLHPKFPTLSRTTVYNTLKLFVEHGVVKMLTIDERNACFDEDTSEHAHFFCQKCGKIFDMPLQGGVSTLLKQTVDGNEILELHQYFKGICKNCREHLD